MTRTFSQVGKQTGIFVRFATVAGENGASDAERVKESPLPLRQTVYAKASTAIR